MTTTELILIWPMTDAPARHDPNWWAAIQATAQHPCGHLVEGLKLDPVTVSHEGGSASLSFVTRIGCGLMRKELRHALSPEVDACLQFGKVIHSARGELPDIESYWCKHRVWLRGGPKSLCSRCRVCGQVGYSPMGNWYIIEETIQAVPIFGTHYGGIVTTPEIAERIRKRRWRKLSIRPLRVLTTPRDGLPVDLLSLSKEQERRWRLPVPKKASDMTCFSLNTADGRPIGFILGGFGADFSSCVLSISPFDSSLLSDPIVQSLFARKAVAESKIQVTAGPPTLVHVATHGLPALVITLNADGVGQWGEETADGVRYLGTASFPGCG